MVSNDTTAARAPIQAGHEKLPPPSAALLPRPFTVNARLRARGLRISVAILFPYSFPCLSPPIFAVAGGLSWAACLPAPLSRLDHVTPSYRARQLCLPPFTPAAQPPSRFSMPGKRSAGSAR